MPLEVHNDARTVATRGAELFVDKMRAVPHERDRFGVALSGDNTPRATYEEIARRAGHDGTFWAGADAAALQYAGLIGRHLGATPRFDLIFLGLGDDGHTELHWLVDAAAAPHLGALR